MCRMIRLIALLGVSLLAACAGSNDLDGELPYMGNFRLGHNVVVAPNLTRGPASRAASKEEWNSKPQAVGDLDR